MRIGTHLSGVGRCLILGGPNFSVMYTLCVHMSVLYVYKAQEKFLKLKFVLSLKNCCYNG